MKDDKDKDRTNLGNKTGQVPGSADKQGTRITPDSKQPLGGATQKGGGTQRPDQQHISNKWDKDKAR